jgi:hypothetical protein
MRQSIWPARLRAFALALALCTVWGSLWQTQFNLYELEQLGLNISGSARLATTVQDLYRFAPLYAAICLVGLVPAFVVAGWFGRGAGRAWLFALAGGVAVAAALRSADLLAGIEVLVFATRRPLGLAALVCGGVLAGWLYAWLRRRN